MRIPFDIKYRPQIESGEYKVCINYAWPIEILSWDCIHVNKKGEQFPILAKIRCLNPDGQDFLYWYNNQGKYDPWDGVTRKESDAAVAYSHDLDLFIVTPEEEMTDFEKKLWEVLKSEGSPIGPIEKFTNADKEVFRSYAAKLLSLAREQLQPEIDAEIEKAYKNADKVMYQKGKEDGIAEARNDISARVLALKQAKDRAEEALKDLPRWYANVYYSDGELGIDWRKGEGFICYKGKIISLKDLMKLPGFKEDEK